MSQDPIGMLDSGVGGLSVLRELLRQHPQENYLYFADQAHVPYGSRTLKQGRGYSESIVRFLGAQGAKLIVVACNTASAAALHPLRRTFPGLRFVGMEPAVKPAAQSSRSRSVGVLATPATFQGRLFASVVERFAQGVELIDPAPAIARQPGRLLAEVGPADPNGPAGNVTLYSTGDAPALARMAEELIQLRAESLSMSWRGLELLAD